MIKRLKICHLINNYYPNQGLLYPLGISQAESKLGHDVTVICKNRGDEADKEIINQVKIYRLKNTKHRNKIIKFLKYLLRIRKFLSTSEFDIIHTYYLKGVSLLKLFSLGTTKATWLLDIRSGPVQKGLKKFIFRVFIFIESSLFKNFIIIENSLKKIIFFPKRDKVRVIPLGTDFQIFYHHPNNKLREKYNLKSSHKIIIYTGNIDPHRKLENVIKGFHLAWKKRKDLYLVLVGKGKEINRLKNLKNALGLKNQVIFTGLINYDEIPQYINGADLAISYIPIIREYYNQPPLKTAEYMACQIPTIATNTAGNRIFIKNNFNGLLINDDPPSLAEAILKILADNNLRNKIISNSRKTIINDYDWLSLTKKGVIPFYFQLLKINL